MIKGYLHTRAQDGLSRLIAAAVAVYVCAYANMIPIDFNAVEDPFQQLFVSNWNSRTLTVFYIPLFLLFLFFQQKVFLESYYRCRFSRFKTLWRARGTALVWDCLLYEALMQLAFLLFSVLLGRWNDYSAHISSIVLSAVGQTASLLLLSLLAAVFCEWLRSAFGGIALVFVLVAVEFFLYYLRPDLLFFFGGFLDYYAIGELLPLLGLYAAVATGLLFLVFGFLPGRDSLQKEKV
ncbi:MAG: hypothetical protein ACLU62_13135 [Hydrogeniiclostridium sp.]